MDKKSKVISRLKTGKIIIQKPNKHFTDSEKHHIIQELLSLCCTKREIWEKYTGQEEEHGQLLRWMKQLGYDASVKTRRPNIKDARELLDSVIQLYNNDRPHLSISNHTPNQVHHSTNPLKTEKLWKNYYQKKVIFLVQCQD